jgi:hypothetical protein
MKPLRSPVRLPRGGNSIEPRELLLRRIEGLVDREAEVFREQAPCHEVTPTHAPVCSRRSLGR